MSWDEVALSELAQIEAGGGAPQEAEAFSEEGLPFFRAGSLPKLLAGADENTLERIQPDVARSYRLREFPTGTLLFAKSGMSATKGHIYRLKQPGYVVNHLAALIPSSEDTGRFLAHALAYRSPTALIQDAAYPSIRLGDVAKFTVPAPRQASERRRIAAILDKADALRQMRKRAIALLDDMTQSIFLETFGAIDSNPFRFPTGTLSDVCTFKGGAQPPKSVFSDTAAPDKIRLIQIRDYKSDRYVTYIPKASAKRFCGANDVMIGRYGPPVFQILRGLEGSYNVALMKAEPKLGFRSEFLFWLLSSDKVQRDVIGQSQRTAGQSGVNLEYLDSYPVYLPPEDLQIEFEERMSLVAKLRDDFKIGKQRMEVAFAALQHRAFAGEL